MAFSKSVTKITQKLLNRVFLNLPTFFNISTESLIEGFCFLKKKFFLKNEHSFLEKSIFRLWGLATFF